MHGHYEAAKYQYKEWQLRGLAPIGVLACPGATGLEYAVVVVIFRRGIYGTVALQARSGPGSHGVMG